MPGLGKECGLWAEGHDFSPTASPRQLSHCAVSTLPVSGISSRLFPPAIRRCESCLENSRQDPHLLPHYRDSEALPIAVSTSAWIRRIAHSLMESMWTDRYESNQRSNSNNRIL